MLPAGVGLLVDRLQSHQAHQPLSPLAVHHPAVVAQHNRHPARSIKRIRQVKLVDPTHHGEIVPVNRYWAVIQRRARDLQELACATTATTGSAWSTRPS